MAHCIIARAGAAPHRTEENKGHEGDGHDRTSKFAVTGRAVFRCVERAPP
jgi:hypothetical protein